MNRDSLYFIALNIMAPIQMTKPSFSLTDMINVLFELEYRQLLEGHYLNAKRALLRLPIVAGRATGTITASSTLSDSWFVMPVAMFLLTNSGQLDAFLSINVFRKSDKRYIVCRFIACVCVCVCAEGR